MQQDGADSPRSEHGAGLCTLSLHCANAEGQAKGPCSIHGVVGGVCAHTVPLLGMFIDMTTNEQFIYYLIMLEELLRERPDLKDVYIDIGCRLMHTWIQFVKCNPQLPQEWADLRLMVNWMHGSTHALACQIVNSGRFKKGAGRRVGENTEQLWSMLKV